MKKFLCLRIVLLSCLACCLMLIPVAVNAVTISYQGYAVGVDEMGSAGNPLQNAGFSVGDLFYINIDFDETSTPKLTGPNYATYNLAIDSFSIAKVGFTANMPGGGYQNFITVHDYNTSGSNDYIDFKTNNFTATPVVSGLTPYYLGVHLSGPFDVFTSTDLPVIEPDPNDFDNTFAILQFYDDSTSSYPFVSIEPLVRSQENPVPEPTTMLLFGAGLVGLAGFGRKKFKK